MKTKKNRCKIHCKNKTLKSILKIKEYKSVEYGMSLLGLKKEYHKEIKDAICQEKDKETNKLISNCETKCNLKKKSKPKKNKKK